MTMKKPANRAFRPAWRSKIVIEITEAADILGVTRQASNNLCNGKAVISRRWRPIDTGVSAVAAEKWLGQMALDLEQARQHEGEI